MLIVGPCQRRKAKSVKSVCSSGSSVTSKWSIEFFRSTIDRLKAQRHCPSTVDNYMCVWRNFNNFIIQLELVSLSWEEKLCFYAAFLVEECSIQSATLKSYISGIKAMLLSDGYILSDDKLLLNCITRACRLKNDHIYIRLPIGKGLLEILMNEISLEFLIKKNQKYLESLYKTAFVLAYYGLFRVSELCQTPSGHALKAKDVHEAEGKKKLLMLLHSSKTHGKGQQAQQIKIEGVDKNKQLLNRSRVCHTHCPFETVSEYLQLRGGYYSINDQLLCFRDGTPLKSSHFRNILKKMLSNLSLNPKLYDTHSFRIGRATDLMKLGHSIEQIKMLGRWKSNAVFKYIKKFLITDQFRGRDPLWIIGDEFSSRTSHSLLNLDEEECFTTRNFETTITAANRFSNYQSNALVRIRNSLVKTINDRAELPKFLIFILEDDLIKNLGYNRTGAESGYSRVIDWLITEIKDVIEKAKQIMPEKALRADYPYILWICPTSHMWYENNHSRKLFSTVLDKAVSEQKGMAALKLRQLWSDTNESLFKDKYAPLTERGIEILWQSIDKTIRYFVLAIQKGAQERRNKEHTKQPIHRINYRQLP